MAPVSKALLIPSRRRLLGAAAAAPALLATAPALAVRYDRRKQLEKKMQLKPVRLPFRVTRNVPWTACRIDGGEPVALGLNVSSVHFDGAPSLVGKKPDETQSASTVTVNAVEIGGVLKDSGIKLFIERQYYEEFPVPGFMGLLRWGAFSIDWDQRIATLAADLRRPPAGYEKLKMGQDGDFWTIDVVLDGLPARLAVLTVVPTGVVLSRSWAERTGAWSRWKGRDDLDQDGRVAQRTVRLESLKIGKTEMKRPIVRLSAGDRWQPWSDYPADGIIGVEALRRLNFAADPRSGDLFVRQSAAFEDIWLDDRAGVLLANRAGAYTVVRLDPEGPAARAGLEKGDDIVEHKGPEGLAGLAWALSRPAGSTVEIVVERLNRRLPMTVTLEERI